MQKFMVAMVSLLLASVSALAAGPHGDITCIACHSPHYAVDNKIFAVKNTQATNPLTGESIQDLVAAKCLGCHQTMELGGAGVRPIHLHTTHPLGIKPNPKIADVPANLLNNGKLDCISCHEPHPSNNNFMYLRVNVGAQGEQLQNFCSTCHSAKADLTAMGVKSGKDMKVFSAMDQAKGSGTFARDDATIHNQTPEYIKPLGKNGPNDLVPNYQNPPEWIYTPDLTLVDQVKKTAKAK
jgi:predicted CXXCH cytochrome family protein